MIFEREKYLDELGVLTIGLLDFLMDKKLLEQG